MSTVRSSNGGALQALADDVVLANATVLVVDDHPPNLALLERILGNAGVTRVHVTMDPRAVVGMYESLRPDLVMLDLHMPGMDGVAVMEALREATAEDEYVPVIVLTADATTEARDRVLAAGASDFLTKPVDRTEVVLRARNLLHRRALHARLQVQNAQLQSEIALHEEAAALARAEAADKLRRVRGALDSSGPRIVFQPITDLGTQDVVGYEALSRFDQSPNQPPNIWFAEADEVGLGIELELAAIEGAVRELTSLPGDGFLTLNVSPATAMTGELGDLLGNHASDRLVLEITEHAQVDDYDALTRGLARLRSDGVRLAIDDAGAGFASLQHILQLCPDIIKLDIALVRDIQHDPVKRALASSLVVFGRDIGASLIAEGIETADELATLTDLGVSWGQGYHLGRPADLADLRVMARSR